MDLIADRGRRVTVEELNTTQLLRHAKRQADERKFEDVLIVDCDAHHYENENFAEILPFMENEVLKQLALAARAKGGRGSVMPSGFGYQDMEALETTFRMINAETQLMYASDYPHWDFDLPSTIYDLPFLSEKAKHNILGGTAARIFKLPPRNEKQKANLIKYGNYTAG